jgi:hypothetical protein
LLSRSVLGTALVLFGGVVFLAGSSYGTALGLVELFSAPSTSPTPAGAGSPFAGVAIVLLFGAVTFALGGWLIEYFR